MVFLGRVKVYEDIKVQRYTFFMNSNKFCHSKSFQSQHIVHVVLGDVGSCAHESLTLMLQYSRGHFMILFINVGVEPY